MSFRRKSFKTITKYTNKKITDILDSYIPTPELVKETFKQNNQETNLDSDYENEFVIVHIILHERIQQLTLRLMNYTKRLDTIEIGKAVYLFSEHDTDDIIHNNWMIPAKFIIKYFTKKVYDMGMMPIVTEDSVKIVEI